jgi:hypothetical protein
MQGINSEKHSPFERDAIRDTKLDIVYQMQAIIDETASLTGERKMNRPLEIHEQRLLQKLLDQCAFDVTNLRTQATIAKVRNVNSDGSILRFEDFSSVPSAPMPPIHLVPVEAVFPDTDGVKIHILLHVREGRLYELEFLKEDATKLLEYPDADEIKDFILEG